MLECVENFKVGLVFRCSGYRISWLVVSYLSHGIVYTNRQKNCLDNFGLFIEFEGRIGLVPLHTNLSSYVSQCLQ